MHILLGIRLPDILQEKLKKRFARHKITVISLTDVSEDILSSVDIIICGGRKFSKRFFEKAKKVKLIQVPWIGVNGFNFEDIKKYHVLLSNSKWNPLLVAEFTLSLILAGLKQQVRADRVFREGRWESRLYNSTLLSNSNILLIGYGDIGTHLARLLQPFSCNIVALKNMPSNITDEQKSYVSSIIGWDSYDEVIEKIDVIVISLPLTNNTKGIVSRDRIFKMKKGAYLVNIGRGDTVDEGALFEILETNHLSGAAIDVWYRYNRHGAEEPFFPSYYPFHKLEHVIMSPHRASTILDAPDNVWDDLEYNIEALENGKPIRNLINLDHHY